MQDKPICVRRYNQWSWYVRRFFARDYSVIRIFHIFRILKSLGDYHRVSLDVFEYRPIFSCARGPGVRTDLQRLLQMCQAVLNSFPVTKTIYTFGHVGDSDVDVRLPNIFVDRKPHSTFAKD